MISNGSNVSENLKMIVKLRRKLLVFVECNKRLSIWLMTKI